jgi:antitoxin component of RelBE/YafQ-DinJ toxin-antitoxin module
MTTARERYEAKTRVVTFRVNQELYEDLEQVRNEAGLSFTDIIKLGAGIALEEIEKKLTEISKLQVQLAELQKSIRNEQKTLDEFIEKQKQERLSKLEDDYQIYSLFDAGWSTEEVSFNKKITQKEAYECFKQWGKLRKQHQAIKTELLKRCLQEHISRLDEQIMWAKFRGYKPGELDEPERTLDQCRRRLRDLSK